jgi:hypothetical protein
MSQSYPANYNGKQHDKETYIKTFEYGLPSSLWKTTRINNQIAITPASNNANDLYIPGNLYVDGTIINPSDITIKENIKLVSDNLTKNIDNLKAVEFTFKDDDSKKIHYGFIAQDFSKRFPNLVETIPRTNGEETTSVLGINYLEIVPLLVAKIQDLQRQIDELKVGSE